MAKFTKMSTVIAVNTRILEFGKLEGIGNFTAEVFKRITQQHPEIEFHFIFNYPFHPSFIFGKNITAHVIQPPAKHPALVKIWYNYSLKRKLKQIKPNLFISPDAITSLTTKHPCLTVMHDINFAHRPQDLPKSWAKFYNKYSKKFAEKSVRVATVSEYSKNDIAETYAIPKDKIDVVYNGVKSVFHPVNKTDLLPEIKTKTQGDDYFFYIGSLHPRKNIINLLKAFDLFKTETKSTLKLVLGGDFLFDTKNIGRTFDELTNKADIIFTGRLTDEALNHWLSGSLALTYVPFFEGFGIPVLEAMSCGTPVITSNTTSLPEVVGNAAITVNPASPSEIAAAMKEVVEKPDLRNQLIERGFEQTKKFSWDQTAELMWESILKSLKK